MRWDYKLVSYLLLTYFIYGIFNFLSLNDFVVPLPLSFIFAPLIAITFLLKTKFKIYSLLYLGMPLLMLKDLIIYYNELIGIIFIILGIITWMILGGLLFFKIKNDSLTKVLAVGLLASPIIIIKNPYIVLGYLLLILILSFKALQSKKIKEVWLERALLLHAFINALFLLNEVSISLVD